MSTSSCSTGSFPPVSALDDEYRDERRAQVRDCLAKAGIKLPQRDLEQLIRNIEYSMNRFLRSAPADEFRDAHDALRKLWELSRVAGVSVDRLRALLTVLPAEAAQQLGRRARGAIPQLFAGETIGDDPFDPPERLGSRFLEWAAKANGEKLVKALQAMTTEGGRIVQGRNRGQGKRSAPRFEPIIMGKVRGIIEARPKMRNIGARRDLGGRPRHAARQELVRDLAGDWGRATGEEPKPGRRDHRGGFSEVVHCVFQWLDQPEGGAEQALRRHWAAVKKRQTEVKKHEARPPLPDFVPLHGET